MPELLRRVLWRTTSVAARSLVVGTNAGRLWVTLGLVALVVVGGAAIPAVGELGGMLVVVAALVAIFSITVRG